MNGLLYHRYTYQVKMLYAGDRRQAAYYGIEYSGSLKRGGRMKIIGCTLAGFCGVYIFWIIPSWIFGWNGWDSPVYVFGDHVILPLFNGIAFGALSYAKPKFKVKKMIILWGALVCPIALALIFFDPNTIELQRQGVHNILELHHVIFIFLELSFIIFMLGVYPFTISKYEEYAPIYIVILYLLVTAFMTILLSTNELPLWKPVTTLSLIGTSSIAALWRFLGRT